MSINGEHLERLLKRGNSVLCLPVYNCDVSKYMDVYKQICNVFYIYLVADVAYSKCNSSIYILNFFNVSNS